MPRGIIGVDNNHAARAGCDRLLQGVKINLPAVVIDQGIAHEPYVLNIGEKAEKRIARLGNQEFVTRIAERPKNKGIGLAGAGSENDVLNRNLISSGGVVCGNGPASCFEALWMGLVRERGWTAERLQDGLPIVVESASRGVRGAQIKQRLPRSTVPGESFTEAVGIEVPVRAVSEHFARASVPPCVHLHHELYYPGGQIRQIKKRSLLGFYIEG